MQRNPKTLTDKILSRLDKIDKDSLEQHISGLVQRIDMFKNVIAKIEDAVILIDPQSRVIVNNPASEKYFDSVEKPHLDHLKDQSLRRFIGTHAKALNERMVEDIQIIIPSEEVLRIFLNPIEYGGTQATLIVLQNRTRETADAMNASQVARIESLVRLAAGIAHEIGNPLNAIGIHLQLLLREIDTLPKEKKGKFAKSLDAMSIETKKMDRIIKNFLKATRKPPLRFQSFSVNQIIKEVIHLMQPELNEKGVKIEFKEDAKIPDFLLDKDRLNQAFLNLIKNAMEAMPEGGFVKIKSSLKDKLTVIRIEDNGSGIEDEDLPHIFDAYFTTKEEGSGLGLMTVYQCILEHGGRIEVTSQKNKGTAFEIFLPLRKPKLQITSETIGET